MIRAGIIFCLCFAACGCTRDRSRPASSTLSSSDYGALKNEFTQAPGGRVERVVYPIMKGKPPLAVLVQAGNSVRVTDATNNSLVAVGAADRDTLISVDAQRGVTLGGETLARGPLASAHDFAIFVDRSSVVDHPNEKRPPANPASGPSR
jgi:hypothetical protein